ncbi:ribosomal protein S6 kinase-like 1 isoform X2 [Boleophthalmus pectinirostris]|nr:ribosomal protein S6 kinase-like 1 isoform X2 [Boleophthalmus pectinirostris]XP_055013343.1 ribosomal protein S6 kinase-like 1 isoform X2 [Boleophthalmus pectinirostris]
MAKRDYLVEAAKQIHMALDSEVNEDYEAAFSYYKNGVDLLLNGVQLDPNKERREAVKRKTTQYLKRAEEIFITHLQDNLGKGSAHLGGYSSLRFRPIRHLSSPVEDLEMCKVVGVSDKVLVVQSMVNKETFVVKSLVKSSWESRDQPTIIPQGVPYMVKLLRYYVSEDAVYLHLEHVKGGRLFSKLHKLRHEKAKEHPECTFPGQHHTRMKTSHTSPAISTDYQHKHSVGQGGRASHSPSSDPTEADFLHRVDNCRTHSYIEETGCLQNTRSSFFSNLDRLSLHSGPSKTHLSAHIHPPAPSLCLQSGESQEKLALPLSCARINQALDVMSGLHKKKAGTGLIECSSDFETAWKATEKSGDGANLYAVADSVINSSPNSGNSESTPAILYLPLHCQTQMHGRAAWDTTNCEQGSFLGDSNTEQHSNDKNSPTPEEKNGMVVIQSTDRAVFSEYTDSKITLDTSWTSASFYNSMDGKGSILDRAKKEVEKKSGTEEAKGAPVSGWSWFGSAQYKKRETLKSESSDGCGEDQIIEVDGWCHLPRTAVKTSKLEKAAAAHCWGLPESEVRVWGAQILLALESLHEQGIICKDLNPRNILLTSNGKVCLTFFGQWSEVQTEICSKAMEQMYCAPEIGGVSRVTESCDWWSLGALLFELLTGMPLWQLHPAGIHSHTQLLIPEHLSAAAASLLTELLQYDAGYRLGSGGGGVSDIKCHPFFSAISWKALSC